MNSEHWIFFLKKLITGLYSVLENVALRKNAWQLNPYENPNIIRILDASNAVDGLKTNLSFFGGQCTQSANSKDEAMWRVDLGVVLGIHHITIYYKTDNVPWGKYNYLYKLLSCLSISIFEIICFYATNLCCVFFYAFLY